MGFKMYELEFYYNDIVKEPMMPEFENLDDRQILALKNSLGFQTWTLSIRIKNLENSIRELFI